MPGWDLDEEPGDSRGSVQKLGEVLHAPGGNTLVQVDITTTSQIPATELVLLPSESFKIQ